MNILTKIIPLLKWQQYSANTLHGIPVIGGAVFITPPDLIITPPDLIITAPCWETSSGPRYRSTPYWETRSGPRYRNAPYWETRSGPRNRNAPYWETRSGPRNRNTPYWETRSGTRNRNTPDRETMSDNIHKNAPELETSWGASNGNAPYWETKPDFNNQYAQGLVKKVFNLPKNPYPLIKYLLLLQVSLLMPCLVFFCLRILLWQQQAYLLYAVSRQLRHVHYPDKGFNTYFFCRPP